MQAIVLNTEQFRGHILGKMTVLQADHKHLETIICKPMATAPLKLEAVMLKASIYDLKLEYLPSKKQVPTSTNSE